MDFRGLEPLNEYDAEQMEMARNANGGKKKKEEEQRVEQGETVHIGRSAFLVLYSGNGHVLLKQIEENPYLERHNRGILGGPMSRT